MSLQQDTLGLSTMARIAIFLLSLVEFLQGDYVTALVSMFSFFVAFSPSIIGRNSKAHLPWSLDFSLSIALLLHSVGLAFNLYHAESWWWWDELTHALGSFVVGMVAFHLVFTLNFLGKVHMSVPMMGIFIFLSAMGIGAIWEIMEFYSDRYLGTISQVSLENTMRDLQFNFIGAVAISFIAMRYLFVKRRQGMGEL
jgi:hypothetical protein